MKIVSISLNEETIEEMQHLQKDLGISGRSELIRAAVRKMLTDNIEKEKLKGNLGCVLTVTHLEKNEGSVTKIKHDFEDIIKTHLHCKLKKENCLEIFVIEGPAEEIKEMTKKFEKNEGMEHVRLIIT